MASAALAHDFFLCTVVGVHRYANGTTQTRDQPLHLHGLGHAGNDAVRRHATQLGTATDQQRILTAEHAAGFHFNALGGGNAARCFQQQRVADRLAEPIVQPLKTVQPHVHHTERTASLFDALYLLLHLGIERGGVEQRRQTVAGGHVGQLSLGGIEFGFQPEPANRLEHGVHSQYPNQNPGQHSTLHLRFNSLQANPVA
jgi:hypothetical protein